jgi:hypothetical protein
VSEYHTEQAFHARIAARWANPVVPAPLGVFYHIGCLNNWVEVVKEQLGLCKHVGITDLHACVLGMPMEVRWLERYAAEVGMTVKVLFSSPNLSLFEGPTIHAAWEWACANQGGAVMYIHTKGNTQPTNKHKERWRRLMGKHVIADWHMNLRRLCVADMVGVSWQELRDFPHYCGNFWMARADWLANLQDPDTYRNRHPGLSWGGGQWGGPSGRFFAETWIGSAPWHHVESFCGKSTNIYREDRNDLYRHPVAIEGFTYR